MQEERFWFLASLKLSGEATPEEAGELAQALKDHPEWSLRFEVFANFWKQPSAETGTASPNSGLADTAGRGRAVTVHHGENPGSHSDSFSRHLQRLSSHLSEPALKYEQPAASIQAASALPANTQSANGASIPLPDQDTPARKIRRWLLPASLAAAATIIGAVAFAWLNHRPAAPVFYNTVTTRPGSRSRLQLPDGTQVWLNADSRLDYRMSDSSREVLLTGEAFFDVARDKDHPFLIHTSTLDIRVLGTSFNVRCYTNEKNTETDLIQGSVEVTLHNQNSKKIILQTHERLTVPTETIRSRQPLARKNDDTNEPLLTVSNLHFQKKDSAVVETLWTRNQLAFDDMSLDQVASLLRHWYGVEVTITEERLRKVKYSGIFENEDLQQVMEALRLTGNFHYTIQNKEVLIAP